MMPNKPNRKNIFKIPMNVTMTWFPPWTMLISTWSVKTSNFSKADCAPLATDAPESLTFSRVTAPDEFVTVIVSVGLAIVTRMQANITMSVKAAAKFLKGHLLLDTRPNDARHGNTVQLMHEPAEHPY
jgi:hypothetical protein